MDMYKRLKRLEKFDSQARDKAKQQKPKLLATNPGGYSNGQSNSTAQGGGDEANMELSDLTKHLGIKGTCMTIEKSYFRLTSAPDPSDVRPEPVLHEAFRMLEMKWADKKADYKYMDDQFRSLRQDCTI